MLTIDTVSVPNTSLVYLAFRLALKDAIERMTLALQFEMPLRNLPIYLTEIPFLEGVAPQVQLDLLADTWQRHHSPLPVAASLIDESVLFAVCETAVRIIESDPHALPMHLKGGPVEMKVPVDEHLCESIRRIHLETPSGGEFLLIGQFLDLSPAEARQVREQFDIPPERLEPLFEVLGRWHVAPNFYDRLRGLLDPGEISTLRQILAPIRAFQHQ